MKSPKISRREALRLTILSGTAVFLTSRLAMSAPTNFQFIAVNDLHYHNSDCDAWFPEVFAAMRTSAPDAAFVLLLGDLADDGKPEQLFGFHQLLHQLGLPWHAVPGNHDWTTATDRSTYEQLFAGHINSSFTHRGWHFLGLDTTDQNHWRDTTIPESTFAFAKAELEKIDPSTPIVLFTHFPLGENIVLTPKEPGVGPFNFRPLNAEAFLTLFDEHNLQAVFSGHYHSQTERRHRNAILTTGKCCSRWQKNHDDTTEEGWFVCDVADGKLTRRFVEIPKKLRG